jgi:hypothetical protein
MFQSSQNKKKIKRIKGMENSEEISFFGISFCNQNLNKQAKHIES